MNYNLITLSSNNLAFAQVSKNLNYYKAFYGRLPFYSAIFQSYGVCFTMLFGICFLRNRCFLLNFATELIKKKDYGTVYNKC